MASPCVVTAHLKESRGMKISYELRQQDFVDAFAAHRKSKPITRWTRPIVITFAGLVILLLLVNVLVQRTYESLTSAMPAFIVFVLWFSMLWAFPRWAARKQFRGQPGAQGLRTLELDQSGTHSQWNGGAMDIEWKNYVRFAEDQNVFLLYSSPVAFNIVPKRVLTADELNGIREMLQQKIRRG